MQPPTDNPKRDQTTPGQALITAFPLVQLRERLLERLRTLQQFAPNSDAVATLKECVSEMDTAITLGRDTNLFISVEEASAQFRRPRSTITHICRTKGKLAGAKKVEGVWVINRHVMTAYFTDDDHGVAA